MKREKGMTLVELLIAMGLSVLIMAATVVIVQYSAATYDNTAKKIKDNNNTYDAVGIVNHYIRTSSYCALSDNAKSIYVTVDGTAFGGTAGEKHTVYIAYDTGDKVLYIDRLDCSAKMVIAEKVSDIKWEILSNGVRYTAYSTTPTGTREKLFSGYAYKRGR